MNTTPLYFTCCTSSCQHPNQLSFILDDELFHLILNAWAKDSVSNALGIVLHFLNGNRSKENTAWSEFKLKQSTKNSKSIKVCCGLLGKSATSRWRKIEEITLNCVVKGKISRTPLFSFHCFLLTSKQTLFFSFSSVFTHSWVNR